MSQTSLQEKQETPRSARKSESPKSQLSQRSQRSRGSKGRRSPERSKGRPNKIYHCPPTPPPEIIREKEKTFVLDCVASSSIATDYSRTNPKLGPVIPPYNSQKDRHVSNYFRFIGVDRTLRQSLQDQGGSSIDGPIMDMFHRSGPGYRYLSQRNQVGAGHSPETVDGHSQFMSDIRPVLGYNGLYGYRRNTPWLRAVPSTFGTASHSPTH